jgi:dTMP kinase
MKSLLIVFEGGEGSGKSTQAQLLSDWMKKRNIPHVLTKEPGCPYIQECVKMRELLLDPKNELTPTAELLLFLSDRAQHVETFIRKQLEQGVHVIGDRFSDSTRIYQCARGFSRSKIDMLLEFATGGLTPDLTILLDVPTNIGLERARAKSIFKNGDRMEQAGTRFHENVRHGFLKLAESLAERHRFVVIDTLPPKTIEETHEEIVKHVSKKLWIKGSEEEND